MKTVGFIGAGKVGTAFAVSLSRAGWQVVGSYDIKPEESQRFAGWVNGARVLESGQQIADGAELVFITTPDDAIQQVADGLRWRSGQTVVHCSGANSVLILETPRQQGASVGCIHPCNTFASVEQSVQNLPGTTFTIEAQSPVRELLKEVAVALQGDHMELDTESKALYHAAACIACNYMYTVVGMGTSLWQHFGLTQADGLKAYLPMLRGTLSNMANVGFPACLTGPIARGDVGTIRKHLQTLADKAPELVATYRMLGLQTVPIARAKGTIDGQTAAELRRLLEQDL